MKYSFNSKLLILFIVFGFFIRFINIWNNPPSLYGDELTMVYDMYSILKTGYDQTGEFLPITFPMGAGRPGGYIYSSIPFIAVFGPTELGVRFLSLISGTGMILLMYFLGRRVFSVDVGIIAAFLTSISMWDISLSRGGFESHFALFLVTLGVVLALYIREKPWNIVWSALLWGLVLHTYPTYKLTLPIFIGLLFYFLKKESINIRIISKQIMIGSGILLLFILIAFYQFFNAGSEKRFSEINVFSTPEIQTQVIQRINYQRSIDHGSDFINNLVHNKVTEYLALLIEGYIKNFSPEFLFLHGDGNPRHNMTSTGGLYLVEIFLLIVGLISIAKVQREKFILIIGWLLIAPLATTLLLVPHGLRNLFMLPPLVILSSIGLVAIWRHKKTRMLIIILILIQFSLFTHRLYYLAPYEFNRFWSYPAKEAVLFIKSEKDNYDYIFVNTDIDNIEYAVPVYLKIDPRMVIEQNSNKTSLHGLEFKKFDNIFVGSIPESKIVELINKTDDRVLYIGNPEKQNLIKEMNVKIGIDNNPIFGWISR